MRLHKIILTALLAVLLSAGTVFAAGTPVNSPGDGIVKPLQTLKAERLKTDLDRRDLIQLSPDMNVGFRSLAEVLIGRVAGVQVTGSYYDYQIRIRGALRPPLIVLDNMPFYSYNDDMINSLLQSISIFDVASIEVIKNIAQAAIYGPGAGNGVILIETKPGEVE